jgi:hypothetical protein
MTYYVDFIGNKILQFGYVEYDVILKDDKRVMPDFRTTIRLASDAKTDDISLKATNLVAVAQTQYDEYLASLEPKELDFLQIDILWVDTL